MTHKILICGATGLVGAHLLPRLADLNYEVITFGRTAPTKRHSNCTHVDGDLGGLDSSAVQALDFDTLIYLAQCREFRAFPEAARSIVSINTVAVIDLLEVCRKKAVSKFVYLSSGGVYQGGDQFLNEDSTLIPASSSNFYIKTKLMAEMAISEYGKYLDTVVFRPFFMYGSGQDRNMLIPRLYDQILLGSEVTLHGENGIEIYPLHAADMAEAILFSLDEVDSGTFNIAGPNRLTIRNIAEIFALDAGVTPSFRVLNEAPLDYRVKSEKLYSKFQVERRSLTSHLADVRP